jgi:hypothetical protein
MLTVDSIVSILAIYSDFAHRLSRLNLIICGVFFVRGNYSIAHHCSDAPRWELAREPLPTKRAKAPVQTSARNGARWASGAPPVLGETRASRDAGRGG